MPIELLVIVFVLFVVAFVIWLVWPASKDEVEDYSPRQFEELVARLFEHLEYDVELTKQSRDGGVDLYARRSSVIGSDELAIECKHYKKSKVGVAPARALYGVLTAQPNLTRGVLITSGAFSEDCRKFAANKRIDLLDGAQLRRLLQEHDLK